MSPGSREEEKMARNGSQPWAMCVGKMILSSDNCFSSSPSASRLETWREASPHIHDVGQEA